MLTALAVILVIMAMIFAMAVVARLWLSGFFVSVLWHACSALSALAFATNYLVTRH
jgi:hypothetical protein